MYARATVIDSVAEALVGPGNLENQHEGTYWYYSRFICSSTPYMVQQFRSFSSRMRQSDLNQTARAFGH